MIARVRPLASGVIAGFGIAKASQLVADKLDEDPDALRRFFPTGNLATRATASEIPRNAVAVIRMSGTIAAPSESPLGNATSINLSKFDQQLTSAFKAPSTAAVVLEINSPGGSPVQSALLHNKLRALKAAHPDVPLLCYCTDVCASGGYYIAAAADEINVLPSSIVGSIGVVSPSLGFAELLKKNGIEDRTLTAGTSKAGDTPLAPRNPVEVAKKRQLLEELHDDFTSAVSAARGDKLKHAEAAAYARQCGDRKDRRGRATALFDGSVYAGRTAVRLGLADGLYEEMSADLRRRFGDDVKIRVRSPKQGLFEKLQALQEAGAQANAAALWHEARVAMSSDSVYACRA